MMTKPSQADYCMDEADVMPDDVVYERGVLEYAFHFKTHLYLTEAPLLESETDCVVCPLYTTSISMRSHIASEIEENLSDTYKVSFPFELEQFMNNNEEECIFLEMPLNHVKRGILIINMTKNNIYNNICNIIMKYANIYAITSINIPILLENIYNILYYIKNCYEDISWNIKNKKKDILKYITFHIPNNIEESVKKDIQNAFKETFVKKLLLESSQYNNTHIRLLQGNFLKSYADASLLYINTLSIIGTPIYCLMKLLNNIQNIKLKKKILKIYKKLKKKKIK
eukprot:GHVL01008192.1.p1 GENE.GHVL01008192.1~~GHVL01008192.1.p1  ORF type:complete len:284 (+),score=95.18 GHVL01008192.1:792-1643(+)